MFPEQWASFELLNNLISTVDVFLQNCIAQSVHLFIAETLHI